MVTEQNITKNSRRNFSDALIRIYFIHRHTTDRLKTKANIVTVTVSRTLVQVILDAVRD